MGHSSGISLLVHSLGHDIPEDSFCTFSILMFVLLSPSFILGTCVSVAVGPNIVSVYLFCGGFPLVLLIALAKLINFTVPFYHLFFKIGCWLIFIWLIHTMPSWFVISLYIAMGAPWKYSQQLRRQISRFKNMSNSGIGQIQISHRVTSGGWLQATNNLGFSSSGKTKLKIGVNKTRNFEVPSIK